MILPHLTGGELCWRADRFGTPAFVYHGARIGERMERILPDELCPRQQGRGALQRGISRGSMARIRSRGRAERRAGIIHLGSACAVRDRAPADPRAGAMQ